jgi:hypothetical protein
MVIQRRKLSRLFRIPGLWERTPRDEVPAGMEQLLEQYYVDSVIVIECGQATEYRWCS